MHVIFGLLLAALASHSEFKRCGAFGAERLVSGARHQLRVCASFVPARFPLTGYEGKGGFTDTTRAHLPILSMAEGPPAGGPFSFW